MNNGTDASLSKERIYKSIGLSLVVSALCFFFYNTGRAKAVEQYQELVEEARVTPGILQFNNTEQEAVCIFRDSLMMQPTAQDIIGIFAMGCDGEIRTWSVIHPPIHEHQEA